MANKSIIEKIYAKINELFGVQGQTFCMEFPGRVLNEATYGFDTDTNYANLIKPQSVIEEEFRLSDDLFGLWQLTGGPSGEKLSTVYEKVLNKLTPNYPKDKELRFIKDKAEMRKWLEEKVVIRSKNEEEDEDDDIEFVGTRMQYYQELNKKYQDALAEWKTEKNEALKKVRAEPDPEKRAELMENYSRFVATVAPARQAKLEALFADLVVRGYYHEVREILGYLDVKSDAELLEETKERMRNSKMSSIDESSVIYPVRFQPNDWFKELSTDFPPEDLLLNREFLSEQLLDKEIRVEQLKRQRANLELLSDDDKEKYEKIIEENRNEYNEANNKLLSEYSNAMVSCLDVALADEKIINLTDEAEAIFETKFQEDENEPLEKGKKYLIKKEEIIEYRRDRAEYQTLKTNAGDAYGDPSTKDESGYQALYDEKITDDDIKDLEEVEALSKKRTYRSKSEGLKKIWIRVKADKAALTDSTIVQKVDGYKQELKDKEIKKIKANIKVEHDTISEGVTSKLARYVKGKLNITKFTAEDVKKIFGLTAKMQEAETNLQNASRALIEINRKYAEAQSKDTQLKKEQLEDEITALEKEIERLRKITSTNATPIKKDSSSGVPIIDMIPKTQKSQQRFQDIIMQFNTNDMESETQLSSYSNKTTARVGFWFWSASVSHESSGSTFSKDDQKKSESLGIGFKAMKVTLDRGGWFDPNIFKATKSMYKLSGEEKISGGYPKFDKKTEPSTVKSELTSLNEALLPAYPIAFVVAKDITIKLKVSSTSSGTLNTVQKSLTQAGAGVFCFSVNGSGTSSSSSESAYAHSEEEYIFIRIPTPQIIGWFLQPVAEDKSTYYADSNGMPEGFLPKDTLSLTYQMATGQYINKSNNGGILLGSVGGGSALSSPELAKAVIIGSSRKPTEGNSYFKFNRTNSNQSSIFDFADLEKEVATEAGQAVIETGHISERGIHYASALTGTSTPDYIIGHGGTDTLITPPTSYKLTNVMVESSSGTRTKVAIYHNQDELANSDNMLIQVADGDHECLLSDLVQSATFRTRKVSFVMAAV